MNRPVPETGLDPSATESSSADNVSGEPAAATPAPQHQVGTKAMALAGFATLVLAEGCPTNHTIATIVHRTVD